MLPDALADAVDVTGDVAALHRQRSTVASDCADRIFGDFFDSRSGHLEPSSRTVQEWRYGEPPTSSLTTLPSCNGLLDQVRIPRKRNNAFTILSRLSATLKRRPPLPTM